MFGTPGPGRLSYPGGKKMSDWFDRKTNDEASFSDWVQAWLAVMVGLIILVVGVLGAMVFFFWVVDIFYHNSLLRALGLWLVFLILIGFFALVLLMEMTMAQ